MRPQTTYPCLTGTPSKVSPLLLSSLGRGFAALFGRLGRFRRRFRRFLRLIQLRQQHQAFSRSETEFLDTGNRHVLGFFRNHEGWGKRPDKKIEVLDACVRGPWQVAERDLFGRVISWRLPIHVAVTDPDLRPRNIARVYELSVLAQEGAPGRAPKAPPFAGYWVGNSWMMRLDRF